MENTSPFVAMQGLEAQLKALLRRVDMDLLEQSSRKVVHGMRQLLTDTRLDIRDYELSETRDEQLKYAREAKKRIARLQSSILAAGDVFTVVDTAEITAKLDQINGWLQ
jgi:hypothetical protein